MPKLTCCIIFYNSAESLRKTLITIRRMGLPSIAVDGRFLEFPGDEIHSTDGSIEVAKEFADLYIPADKSFLKTQMDKRNRYVQEIKTGEYFGVVDDDEQLKGAKIDTEKLELDSYSLRYVFPAENITRTTIRIWKKYDDLKYAVRHCYLFRESQMDKEALAELAKIKVPREDLVNAQLAEKIMSGVQTTRFNPNILKGIDGRDIQIVHYPEKRSVERQHADNIYTSTRREFNLNQYLQYPEKRTPIDMPPDTGQDCIMLYEGTETFNDGQLGTLQPDTEYPCKYSYALKLREDFGIFSIIKIIPTKEEQLYNKFNARFKALEKRVKALEERSHGKIQ